jgi:hypothetical protein
MFCGFFVRHFSVICLQVAEVKVRISLGTGAWEGADSFFKSHASGSRLRELLPPV